MKQTKKWISSKLDKQAKYSILIYRGATFRPLYNIGTPDSNSKWSKK